MILPNLIIAGVNKSGTSSLFTYLNQHPDISGSSKKETCFYLPVIYEKETEGIDSYAAFFSHCAPSSKIILEATPGYFYGGKKLAEKIKKDLGNIRIIFMFRDPVQRAISFFSHLQAKMILNDTLNFEESVQKGFEMIPKEERIIQSDEYLIRMIREGVYNTYLEEWYNVFGAENIHVVFLENLERNPRKEVMAACEWLGVDAEFYRKFNFQVENKTVKYKNRFFHTQALRVYGKLEVFFRKNNKLKNRIRDTYYKFNAMRPARTMVSEVEQKLNEYYMASNRSMAKLLTEKGYDNLPSWLQIKDN